ncbi:hypothetical protein CS022_04575 [Veronia nyctiphanis]|uniref:Uncharacterized protein n=1 Tax=Veronia nyctiphanis TaxID=1278244 RepID=A0A4Q0YSV1_9GAMM|nr:hypothetical protein [Veronia nyctiphanis]RXJ74330.1 hypothetical protein CS022_04575 [Veronia nyctiphanis]
MTSRNKRYELGQKAKGLKKVTLWVPESRESDIKLAICLMIEDENLTVNVLRNMQTGRLVSMNK